MAASRTGFEAVAGGGARPDDRTRTSSPSPAAGGVHTYTAEVVWENHTGSGTRDYGSYGRRFRIAVDGKAELSASADAAFRGEPYLHNPEDLFVAAVAGCHMLFYLSLCARNGITVVAYRDAARGTLASTRDGGGHFEEILLRPRVTVAREQEVEKATGFHHRAGELCFLARSCSFPVRHQPVVCSR